METQAHAGRPHIRAVEASDQTTGIGLERLRAREGALAIEKFQNIKPWRRDIYPTTMRLT